MDLKRLSSRMGIDRSRMMSAVSPRHLGLAVNPHNGYSPLQIHFVRRHDTPPLPLNNADARGRAAVTFRVPSKKVAQLHSRHWRQWVSLWRDKLRV